MATRDTRFGGYPAVKSALIVILVYLCTHRNHRRNTLLSNSALSTIHADATPPSLPLPFLPRGHMWHCIVLP